MSSDLPTLRRMLIRKMVVDMAISEKTIEQVIAHSFDSIVKALKNNRSVEISGLGKFELRKGILEKEVKHQRRQIEYYKKQLEDPLMSEIMKERRRLWIENHEQVIEYVKTRGYNED